MIKSKRLVTADELIKLMDSRQNLMANDKIIETARKICNKQDA